MTDIEALKKYVTRGDAMAFSQLVETYSDMVYAVCSRSLHNVSDIEDAVQETFLKLARDGCRIRENVASWLYACARSTAIDHYRSKISREQREARWAYLFEGERLENWKNLLPEIDDCLQELPVDDRELYLEFFFARRTQAELAGKRRISQQAVQKRLKRITESIRKSLRGKGVLATAVTISSFLSLSAQAQAPAHLTAAAMKIGIAGVGTGSGFSLTTLGALVKTKAAAAVVATSVIVGGTVITHQTLQKRQKPVELSVGIQDGQVSATAAGGYSVQITQLPAVPACGMRGGRGSFDISPDGQFLASGIGQTFIVDLFSGSVVADIGDWNGEQLFHRFSPSGEYLIVISLDRIAVVSTDSWRIRADFRIPKTLVGSIEFTSDERTAFCMTDLELVTVDLVGMRVQQRDNSPFGRTLGIALAPNDKWLAVCGAETNAVSLFPLDSEGYVDIQAVPSATSRLNEFKTKTAMLFRHEDSLIVGNGQGYIEMAIPDLSPQQEEDAEGGWCDQILVAEDSDWGFTAVREDGQVGAKIIAWDLSSGAKRAEIRVQRNVRRLLLKPSAGESNSCIVGFEPVDSDNPLEMQVIKATFSVK